jgi:hypothetical protein
MIDPEFESLITPLKPDEYAELEKSILEEGCRDPIITWKGVIVDGHNRYTICRKHSLEFKTVERDFESRDDAKIWMIRNQIGRRNLNDYERSRLALKMKPLISKKAKKNQQLSEGRGVKGCQNSDNLIERVDTKKELAKIAGVSHDTIARVEKIVQKAPEEVKEKLRRGDPGVSINKVFNDIKKEETLQRHREELAEKGAAVVKLPPSVQVYHGDFLKDYHILGEGSVDCIITDPPYVKDWLENYEGFARAAEYVLKPGGFLITYVGHIHLDRILDQMCRHLDFYWIAALKHAGTTKAVHSRSVMCGFKPILIFHKPPRMAPKRYFCDVILGTGREKSAHEWQQGKEELRQIFEPFTDPGDTVLDPFMGSGTVLDMAREMGRKAIGFDIDAVNVQIVRGRVAGVP